MAVFVAVGGVDLRVEVSIARHIGKGDVFGDSARLDAALVARLGATKPGAVAATHGADTERT